MPGQPHEPPHRRQTVTHSPASRRNVLKAAALAAPVLAGAGATAHADDAERVNVEFAYEAIVTLGPIVEVGQTPFGRRIRIPITGGSFAGPRIRGKIVPEGMDWQLVRPDGYTSIEARYLMQTDDGALIHICNQGIVGPDYIRTTPVFEAPQGPHAWLNQSVFTATIAVVGPPAAPEAVRIRVCRLL